MNDMREAMNEDVPTMQAPTQPKNTLAAKKEAADEWGDDVVAGALLCP